MLWLNVFFSCPKLWIVFSNKLISGLQSDYWFLISSVLSIGAELYLQTVCRDRIQYFHLLIISPLLMQMKPTSEAILSTCDNPRFALLGISQIYEASLLADSKVMFVVFFTTKFCNLWCISVQFLTLIDELYLDFAWLSECLKLPRNGGSQFCSNRKICAYFFLCSLGGVMRNRLRIISSKLIKFTLCFNDISRI